MEVALIPPASQLAYCIGRRMQMIIPAYLEDQEYTKFYKSYTARSRRGKTWFMLDCGVYEGKTLRHGDLLRLALEYEVDEVIPPDTLGNPDASWEQLHEFLSYKRHPAHRKVTAAVVVPIQGSAVDECRSYIDRVAKITLSDEIHALALPKHLPETTGRSNVRLMLLHYIKWNYSSLDVHFLGYNDPEETKRAAQFGVRSMDTSMPFVVAAAGALLSDPLDKLDRKREMELRELTPSTELVMKNIGMLDEWAARRARGVRLATSEGARFIGERGPESFHLSESDVIYRKGDPT